MFDPKTKQSSPLLPYGKVARAGLLYINSEIHRTHDRHVSLGRSQREFMKNLGFSWGGRDARRVMRQMEALAKSQFTLTRISDNQDGTLVQSVSSVVASVTDLWFPLKIEEEGQESLFESSIVVSQDMMELLETAMPVDLRAWRYLNETSKSPLVLDVYQWLSERAHRAPKARGVLITWEQLRDQFAPDSVELRSFKRTFLGALDTVRAVYSANIDIEDQGMRLRYTKAPVMESPSWELPS